MTVPAILVVTGIDGVGKSTAIDALEERALPGIQCFRFETIGSPSLGAMMAEHGSPQAWQVAAMHQWVTSLTANQWRCRVAVLEGEIPPLVVQRTFIEHGITRGRVVLLSCEEALRTARSRRRSGPPAPGQSRLAWAQSFREQAEALHLPILDTTSLTPAETVDRLLTELEELAPTR